MAAPLMSMDMNIKRLIYLLLLLPAFLQGQTIPVMLFPYTSASESVVYSDDFEGYNTGQDLDNDGEWNMITGSIDLYDNSGDNVVTPDNADDRSYYYYNATLDADQYAELTVDALTSSRYMGPSVRGSTTVMTCYYFYVSNNASYLRRIVSGGSNTTLATGGAYAADDVVRLEVEGDVLSCFKNGVLDTSIDTDGKYTDDSGDKLTSGVAGMMGYGTGATYADEWEGGEL